MNISLVVTFEHAPEQSGGGLKLGQRFERRYIIKPSGSIFRPQELDGCDERFGMENLAGPAVDWAGVLFQRAVRPGLPDCTAGFFTRLRANRSARRRDGARHGDPVLDVERALRRGAVEPPAQPALTL